MNIERKIPTDKAMKVFIDGLRIAIESHNKDKPFTFNISEYYGAIGKVPVDDLHMELISALTAEFPLLVIGIDGDTVALTFEYE